MTEALAFLHGLEEACAGRIEPFAYGRGFFRDELPNVWDLNFLRVEGGDPSALDLVASADRMMARLDHRRVVVDDEALATRLDPEFPAGWTAERHLLMEHRRSPETGSEPAHAVETSAEELYRLWDERHRREGRTPETARMLRRMGEITAEVVPTRCFAAYADGAPVSCCDLYCRGGIGQIENVITREEHRGRGFASAVVLAALAASQAEENELTFLVADADDWPQHLYERLGFDPAGRRWLFQVLPA